MTGSMLIGNNDFPEILPLHINEKEGFAVTLAVSKWAPFLRNWRVIIHSDTTVTVNCINKCTSRNSTIMQSLRTVFCRSAQHNFYIAARHIPGRLNWDADAVSRLHEHSAFWYCLATVADPYHFIDLTAHMSTIAFRCLLSRHLSDVELPRSLPGRYG